MSSIPEKPSAIDPGALKELAGRPGFVLLREGMGWRLYREPREVLTAIDVQGTRTLLERIEGHVKDGGEAAGFLHYEAGLALEPKLQNLLHRHRGMLGWFGLYDGSEFLSGLPRVNAGTCSTGESFFTVDRATYYETVAQIRQWIAAGDVYQINFTGRIPFRLVCNPWDLFLALSREHPVPYAAFVNTGAQQAVCLSPELFFRIDGDRIVVRPMKGTAARGLTLPGDHLEAQQLEASEKNRAENVMIVDLMRNDLGRICRIGSVETIRLFETERYPTLWQMTSTIAGALRPGWTVPELMTALFPSGSVTGAPKIRAMELLAALEDSPRGLYTGSIGYFAPAQAQFNVAIRTTTVEAGTGVLGVGSGITFDSSPDEEWEECKWKASFLQRRIPEFQILETLLFDGEYRLLEAHLSRMAASAEYFQFEFNAQAVRAALADAARKASGPARMRVLLDSDASVQVEARLAEMARYGRVCIAGQRVSSNDRFLYHKTTNRRIFDRELAAARNAGCDDALFLNETGAVTEGAIHNIFLVKDGVWTTPPVECGLLAGTYRAKVLKEHPETREEPLYSEDLRQADAIYLCNSVRGIYPVELRESAVQPLHGDSPEAVQAVPAKTL